MTATITIQTEAKKIKTLRVVLKAMDIGFQEKPEPYNPEFVAKIKESEADFQAGHSRKITHLVANGRGG